MNTGEAEHEGTRLESVEEIRQALERTPTVREAAVPETTLFRPLCRPPMALLGILDDGRTEGEWLRIRGDDLVIGRTEGDVRIPHDGMMSSRHARLSREARQGRHRWYLTDLDSSNGTFVRVGVSILRTAQEVLLGSRRFRFDEGASPPAEPASQEPTGTRGWQMTSASELIPSLVELTPQGEGRRHLLLKPRLTIGRDPSGCDLAFPEDRLLSQPHAVLIQDDQGRWHLKNLHSLNGTWVRIRRLCLEGACQFQLGEQRFSLRFLS